jgi:hypothetical protein
MAVTVLPIRGTITTQLVTIFPNSKEAPI